MWIVLNALKAKIKYFIDLAKTNKAYFRRYLSFEDHSRLKSIVGSCSLDWVFVSLLLAFVFSTAEKFLVDKYFEGTLIYLETSRIYPIYFYKLQ